MTGILHGDTASPCPFDYIYLLEFSYYLHEMLPKNYHITEKIWDWLKHVGCGTNWANHYTFTF